jgi:aminoglycoside N3'-acetyltransferase
MSLYEKLSGLAVRRLKREHLLALRARYHATRSKLRPLLQAVYGTFDTQDLRAHLEERIGSEFEILMVHSSVNNMKPMYTDGPLDLLKMLIDFVGPHRTLAMPAFYFGDPKYGSTRETLANESRFDVRRTPSQMGLLTELFRRSKGVVQSRNPIYRISALGPMASDMTRGHEHTAQPNGIGSPFDFMDHHDTLVIGIGKTFEVLTHAHYAEEVLGAEFPVPRGPENPLPMTLVDGEDEIPFVLRGGTPQWTFNIWKLRSIMDGDSLKAWSYHHVPLFAARAREVTGALVAAARRGVTLYDEP